MMLCAHTAHSDLAVRWSLSLLVPRSPRSPIEPLYRTPESALAFMLANAYVDYRSRVYRRESRRYMLDDLDVYAAPFDDVLCGIL